MRVLLGLICIVAMNMPVMADELDLVLNGKALHLRDGKYNEKNWGLGFNYDFDEHHHWINFLHGSVFKDSNNQTSNYLGGGMKRRYHLDRDPNGWRVDGGFIAFLMTRQDFHNNNPFFGALPFVAVGKGWFTLNATYIPAISPKHTDLFFFQAMVRVAQF
ncbi:MAG: hypothetical protein HY080_06620 [Gammaproteobacteria bacterium]|nr:hypothetical protein [Gammaproteobacteria bacterium]